METLDKKKQIFFCFQLGLETIALSAWQHFADCNCLSFLSKRYRIAVKPIAAIKMKQFHKSVELKKIFFYSVLLLFFSFCSEQSYYKRFSSNLFFLSCKNTKHRKGVGWHKWRKQLTLTLVNFSMYNNSKLVGRDNIIITSSCVELFTSGLRERTGSFFFNWFVSAYL